MEHEASYVGIDVAKSQIDVAARPAGDVWRVDYGEPGVVAVNGGGKVRPLGRRNGGPPAWWQLAGQAELETESGDVCPASTRNAGVLPH